MVKNHEGIVIVHFSYTRLAYTFGTLSKMELVILEFALASIGTQKIDPFGYTQKSPGCILYTSPGILIE